MNIERCSFDARPSPIPQEPCNDNRPSNDWTKLRTIKEQRQPQPQPLLSDKFDNDLSNQWTRLLSNQWPELLTLGDDTDNITRTLYEKWCKDNPEECQRFKPSAKYIPGQQFPQLPIPRNPGIPWNPLSQQVALLPFGQLFGYNIEFKQIYFQPFGFIDILAGYLGTIIGDLISQALGIEGRPKEAATDDISRYANSASPVLQQLGIGAYELAIRNIPISSPDAFKIFGPYFVQAAHLLLSEHLDDLNTLKKCANFLAQCLHAMGNPNDSQWAITELINLERKAGIIKTAAQIKAIEKQPEEHNTKVNRSAIRHERGWEHRFNTPVSRRHAVPRA